MRIFITSGHSFEGETGSALLVKNLAYELAKKHKVLYSRLDKKLEVVKVNSNLTYLNIPSVNINNICIPVMTASIRKKIFQYVDYFNPDIVHGENIIFGGILALIWANKRRVPFVLTFHSQPQEGMVYVYPNLKTNNFLARIDSIATKVYISSFLKYVDKVIALNQVIINGLKEISPGTKYVRIDNGVKLEQFKNLKTRNPNKVVNFIFPGSYIGRKNQEFLIEAFRFLPENYRLNLYGNIKSGYLYAKKLKLLAKKYKLKNITIGDYLNEKQLITAYRKSDYLVSASVKEVQSLVFIEALAAGKPIVALRNETTDDVIKNGNCLTLPQGISPEKFSNELKIFVEKTNKEYEKISKSCKKIALRFDIKNTAKKTAKVYERVIQSTKKEGKTKQNPIALEVFLSFSGFAGIIEVAVANVIKIIFKLSRSFERQI